MSKSTPSETSSSQSHKSTADPIICGIVMPISAIDGCSETHWAEVRRLIEESITASGFVPNMVSEGEETGMIQPRIVQNLYDYPIVVCDVSAKNPNVMFELGIRIAFDKPTVIVKDDNTNYSFDTQIFEHVNYPRDLRYNKIVAFKERLSQKIKSSHDKALGKAKYSPFMEHFSRKSIAHIDTKSIPSDQFITEQFDELRRLILTTNSKRDRFPAGGTSAARAWSEVESNRNKNFDDVLSRVTQKAQIVVPLINAKYQSLSRRDQYLKAIDALKSDPELRYHSSNDQMLEDAIEIVLSEMLSRM